MYCFGLALAVAFALELYDRRGVQVLYLTSVLVAVISCVRMERAHAGPVGAWHGRGSCLPGEPREISRAVRTAASLPPRASSSAPTPPAAAAAFSAPSPPRRHVPPSLALLTPLRLIRAPLRRSAAPPVSPAPYAMASSQTTWSLPPSLSSPPSLATPTAPTPSSNGGGALQWIMGVSDADAERAWSSFIGIVVAICGNILISLALNVQKYAHMRLEREARGPRWQLQRRRGRRKDSAASPIDEEDEDTPLLEVEVEDDHGDREDTNYISSPYWWTGLVMMFFGECGNFLAYGFAPASIVSPLGVVALVCNCVVAPLMLKEPFRKRDLFGVLVSIMGAVTVVWSAEKEETRVCLALETFRWGTDGAARPGRDTLGDPADGVHRLLCYHGGTYRRADTAVVALRPP